MHVVISDCEVNLEFNELLEFSNVKFVNVNFNGIRLDQVFFKIFLFNNCDLSDTLFYEASLYNVEFNKCRLIGVILTEARMEHVLFNQCNLQLASLGNSRQRFVKYDECIL